MLFEVLLVVLLILLNGLFSMIELAMVSARHGTLLQMAEAGNRGARAALAISEQPGHFLSTVQFGITVVGILAGAFSGATFAEPLASLFPGVSYAEELAFTIVVATITMASIVIGELIPKQLALNHATTIASTFAPFMNGLSRVAYPVVASLDAAASLGLRVIGQAQATRQTMSIEEVRRLISESTRAGVFSTDEHHMLDKVMGLGDRRAVSLMTPRPEVQWIDADEPVAQALATIRATTHPRLPYCLGVIEQVRGIIVVKDVLDRLIAGDPIDLPALMVPATIVPESLPVIHVVTAIRNSPSHIALVVDEFGTFTGVISASDIISSIVGTWRDELNHSILSDEKTRMKTITVDSSIQIVDAHKSIGIHLEPGVGYNTLAGFILERLGHIPAVGESFEGNGIKFEVKSMDGLRIDQVEITLSIGEPDPTNEG